MRRYELLQQLLPVLRGKDVVEPLVVCNIGYPSRELYGLGDRPTFFYMLGSMGLASSIGLGLALNTDRRVVALDGDGSVLMNLGTLATIGNEAPANYTLLIVDNGSYGSTGDQPTFTAGRTRLAEMARGAGVAQVFDVSGEEAATTLRQCLAEPGPQVIVARVEPGSVPGQIIPLAPTAIRDRFMGVVGAR
jgi:sulfopyruvate decarboxylase subunit beta